MRITETSSITPYFAVMEFGLINDLNEVDFTLPPDTELTNKTLQEKRGDGDFKVFIGASKWGEKSWKGQIYPKRTPDNQLLGLYSENFNCVEFGPSFYKVPTTEEVGRWASQVADSSNFKFCPKFPQGITHIRRLANAEQITAQFYNSLSGFGNHLGPLLLQLGDNFSPKSFLQLKTYLQSLDPTNPVHLEVRNKGWFAEADHRKELFSFLYDHNVGTVISDTSGRRDCVHMELTTPNAVIRFVGNDLAQSDYKRMDDWVERLSEWKEKGLKSVWFFMHQNNERFVPEACIYFINKLNANLGTSIKTPQIVID
jgi:uncharacterized protein YecE (DUF72 family)